MILEMGMVVSLGLLLTFCKLSWRARMKMLSNPVAMDIAIFVILTIIHWGTFSGVMTATVGSLVCSGMISAGRWAFGYCDGRIYHPGVWSVAEKLA